MNMRVFSTHDTARVVHGTNNSQCARNGAMHDPKKTDSGSRLATRDTNSRLWASCSTLPASYLALHAKSECLCQYYATWYWRWKVEQTVNLLISVAIYTLPIPPLATSTVVTPSEKAWACISASPARCSSRPDCAHVVAPVTSPISHWDFAIE